MANESNLIPVKKGEIRNPKGRGKGTKSFSTIIEKVLRTKINIVEHPLTRKPGVKMTVREMIVLAMVKEASEGNVAAFNTLMERLEGKVKDSLDLEVKHRLLSLTPFGAAVKRSEGGQVIDVTDGNSGLLQTGELQSEADGGSGVVGAV